MFSSLEDSPTARGYLIGSTIFQTAASNHLSYESYCCATNYKKSYAKMGISL